MQHPQQEIHQLSLLSRPEDTPVSSDTLHTYSQPAKNVRPSGNLAAQQFWLNTARLVSWINPPTAAYGSVNNKQPAWFPDGVINTCYNCLDRHCLTEQGRERPCFHHVSPLEPNSNQPRTTLSYGQVLDNVQLLAGVLRYRFDIQKGDRVIIYMSMIPEAAMAMLACARLGAIHSFVFGGFAAKELAKRIDDAKPKLVIASSAGIEPKGVVDYKPLVDQAIEFTPFKPESILLLRRTQLIGHKCSTVNKLATIPEYDFKEELEIARKGQKRVDECVSTHSSDPLYILYTSGTTGVPKGVVRSVGGHAVAARLSMSETFGLSAGDTIFTASDLGWVVGHTYILYAPLLLGCTSVIFEGKPILPDAGIFWKIVQDYHVKVLFTAPTALRAIGREDRESRLMKEYNISHLKALFVAGERCEPSLIKKYSNLLSEAAPGAIVNDNWWSTESGSPITCISLCASYPALKNRPGSAGIPLPGMDVCIVDDDGNQLPTGKEGNVVIGTPLAPSFLTTLWNNQERFFEAYMKRFNGKGNWYDTGDSGMIDQDGFVHVLSRADDVINVAGHRLSTSLIEQVISSNELVAECCVVGMPDEIKGHVPFALITPATTSITTTTTSTNSTDSSSNQQNINSLLKSFNQNIRNEIGAIAQLGEIAFSRLPKTRSGKTLRRTVKNLVENALKGDVNAQIPFPPTIEDPSAVDDAKKAIFKKFSVKASL